MSYVAWFLVLFAVISLWGAAMSQIAACLGRGVFPTARLAAMALTVSVVAVIAIVTAGGAFSVVPHPVDAREGSSLARTRCAAEVRGAFVFSFGLEQGSRVASGCQAGSPAG